MRKSWKPAIRAGSGTLQQRLLAALERDIRTGTLPPGTRLPPHRDLAYELGIGVGTVTRTYAEAERRGLLVAQVGRGSFVAGRTQPGPAPVSDPTAGTIDLARNYPPVEPARRVLDETLTRLRGRADLLDTLGYASPDGPLPHRTAMADWLRRRHGIESANADGMILCNGAQQALALAFSTLIHPGDAVLCEAATFHGFKALADRRAYRLTGVALDNDGLEPEALDRAAAATGARVLYTIPTLQNPTASVMSETRRRDIVDIARRHDLTVVEDDVYGIHARAGKPPVSLRDLAPERVCYVSSVSKSLAPGLRVGSLVTTDDDMRDRVLRAVRASHYAPSALPSLICVQWIEDGSADAIADEVLGEIAARHALARSILGQSATPATAGLHLWLPMSELDAERVAGRAMRAGVEVTPPSAPIVDPRLISGLRLCLGAAQDRTTLERALRIVAAAISSDVDETARDVV